MKLFDVLKTADAQKLDEILQSKGNSPVLQEQLGEPQNTIRFMRACLRGSYLFGKHVVPIYTANVFDSLPPFGPANDQLGKVIRKLMDLCVGELATNNICGREGESHCHFHDLYAAYFQAGGYTHEFDEFIKLAEVRGTVQAIELNPDLWSRGAARFANRLLACLRNPLASFIVMPCNEILTTIIYPPAIKNMSRDERFAAFRHFLEVHVQLDGDDHGAAAMDWLSIYIEKMKPTHWEIEEATKKVLELHE